MSRRPDLNVEEQVNIANGGKEAVATSAPSLRWRKSSFSMMGDCVELADTGGGVGVRDSKHPDAATLQFSRGQLAGFVDHIKAGDLDDLLAD